MSLVLPASSLLLIRHGETALNASRTMQPADTPLGVRGLAQAQALAAWIAPQGLTGLVSSDLPRALQTAQAIADATGLPIHTSELLHERHFGALRGRPYDSLGFDPRLMQAAPAGGESMDDFLARTDRAFAHILALHGTLGGPLAVVSHGLVIGAWLRRRVQATPGLLLPAHVANTSVSAVSALPPHAALHINSTEHLPAALREGAGSLAGG